MTDRTDHLLNDRDALRTELRQLETRYAEREDDADAKSIARAEADLRLLNAELDDMGIF